MTLKTLLIAAITFGLLSAAHATTTPTTARHELLSNDKTKVWETTIYPSESQKLSMHRHDSDRVLIALDNGVLKVTNDKGESHLLKLNQGKAYFLSRDKANELHTDENLSQHAIRVFIIEFRA